MKIHVMSVAYERPISMRILIDCFLVQTNPNWDLTIVHDGDASKEVRDIASWYDDPRIMFMETKERRQQYGHPNRQSFLKDMNVDLGDFVLLTNDDNYYCPVFVDKIIKQAAPNVGMIYMDTVHSHFDYDVLKTQVKVDRIDIGSFVTRADVAKTVGFNNFKFNGDGVYAVSCLQHCQRNRLMVSYIPKPLFIHN